MTGYSSAQMQKGGSGALVGVVSMDARHEAVWVQQIGTADGAARVAVERYSDRNSARRGLSGSVRVSDGCCSICPRLRTGRVTRVRYSGHRGQQ